MKKVILTLVAVAFLAATIFSTAFAAEPKEAFTIDFLQNKKPPVVFPHKKHSAEFGVECKTCHHTLKSNDGEPKACSACHKATEENVIEGVGTAPAALHNEKGTKNILHDKCVACHKEKDKGPKKCKQCHPK